MNTSIIAQCLADETLEETKEEGIFTQIKIFDEVKAHWRFFKKKTKFPKEFKLNFDVIIVVTEHGLSLKDFNRCLEYVIAIDTMKEAIKYHEENTG